jgi:hypothetical protein
MFVRQPLPMIAGSSECRSRGSSRLAPSFLGCGHWDLNLFLGLQPPTGYATRYEQPSGDVESGS